MAAGGMAPQILRLMNGMYGSTKIKVRASGGEIRFSGLQKCIIRMVVNIGIPSEKY